MTTQEPGWDLYRAFLAVLEEGSLSGGARSLGLTQPTVGRQIEALERALGVKLFTRSQTGLAATDTALTLRPFAENLRASANALRRASTDASASSHGTVRITASDVVGVEVLPSILTTLREQHPAIKIELVLSNRNQDLLQRDADIAVRMAQPSQAALIARRVGAIPLGLFVHRRYVELCGMPASIADLKNHVLIGFDQETNYIRNMLKGGLPLTRAMFSLCTDNQLAQLAAIRAGYGVGMCQTALAKPNPDLLPVLPAAVKSELETWIVMHEDLRSSERCRIVFDALASGVSAYISRYISEDS
ncbi:LysR family transcriptional regulator [Collimonas sp.]|jgi:DNA-binding transcriptional LysR family regulator|uniref:LysR family transcriptional regulator n=1 Tax=Collimonas sp. TaxID=1963772 RepID=UPI002B632AFB|nr:LysR family transcriptional regulator [Collimonas sp.]HWW05822.1 LysR family transcriptional regulator [Collimonas sp.]